MKLTHYEYTEFLRTHLDLLFFTGHQMKIIPGKTNYDEFLKLDLQIKYKCREAFLDNEKLLDDFLSKKSKMLTPEQIKILNGFKKMIRSDFIIFKCLTDHSIFIDMNDNKFYAVKALGDRFDELFEHFPVVISTVLLPYNEQIIYDGFLQSKEIYIGSGMTSAMNKGYQKAKAGKQIITTI